ncbi:MAG: hypothetical protein WDZ46_01230 [Solirubrobacterales bacterium]
MSARPANTVEVDPRLLKIAHKVAGERGVAVPQLVNTALEHELGDDVPQPPFSLIGAFTAGRSDLSARASRDELEPRPFR